MNCGDEDEYPKFDRKLTKSIGQLRLGEKLVMFDNDFKFEVLNQLDNVAEWTLPDIKLDNLSNKSMFSSFFSIKINDDKLDRVQKLSKDTLFSALVSKKVPNCQGLELNLDIPDLPQDTNFLKWQIPSTHSYEWIDFSDPREQDSQPDEGFVSNKCSPYQAKENQRDRGNKNISDQIWEQIVDLQFSDYIDWDMKSDRERLIIGYNLDQKISKSKFLLIDSDRKIFDYFYYHYLNTISIIVDKNQLVQKLVIKESNFLIDCLNVMLSLPSVSFNFSKSMSKFVFNMQVQVSGVSSEALGSLSDQFLNVGTLYKKVLDYVKIPDIDSTCGSVFRAYINSVKSYLNFYSEKIINFYNLLDSLTLISLFSKIKPLIDQFNCLVNLIELAKFDPLDPKPIRKGSNLIYHLFNETMNSSCNDYSYQISLHLLAGCLEPFFGFIDKWIFDGKFMDKFDQFFISYQPEYSVCLNQDYLLKAFKLKDQIDHNECNFIKKLYDDIFYCGRNMALLRLCDPENLLCSAKSIHPKLKVDFNQDYLSQIEESCGNYANHVRNYSKYQLKSRQEYLELELRKQDAYLRRLQSEALERFKQYEQQEAENRLQEIEAKQQRFNFLKKQMEEDLKRRQEEKDKEKQLDKEYMDTLVNRNSQFNLEKQRLEEQLKQEIEQEYEQKMLNAEQREQAARKKIQETMSKINKLDESAMDVDMEKQEAENDQEDVVEMEVDVDTPVKMKPNDQTVEKDYKPSIKLNPQVNLLTQSPDQSYRSSIKLNPTVNSLTESPGQEHKSPSIKMSQNFHVSKESDFSNLELKDKQRLEWLRARAVHGHASDSKIQTMLKHDDLLSSLDEQAIIRAKLFDHFTKKEDRVDQINFDEIIRPYAKSFPRLDQHLDSNYLANLSYEPDDDLCFGKKVFRVSNSAELQSFRYVDLEEILDRILYKPVQVQLQLVNMSCINYFLFDLRLEDHLQALRKYVLFENGIFAQKFVDELMLKIEDMHYNGHFVDLEFLLSPIYLKEAFAKTCSLFKNCQFISNLFIRLNRKENNSTMSGLLNYLDMIELVYVAKWPLNIVINQTNLDLYNEIFGFLLKIKFVLTALNNIWQTLRRYELVFKSNKSHQLRQLKLYCHEMQHYMIALQSYIYHQVIQVTWEDLQQELNKVKHVDDLIEVHQSYIKQAHSRCLFKKIPNVVQVILNTFDIIIKFRLQIVNGNLIKNGTNGAYEHEFFAEASENYQIFKKNIIFLHQILQKGISIGYEYHLNNLALTLNYNHYYGTDKPIV